MSGAPVTVLIVDDEVDIRLLVRVLLASAGLSVEVVGEAGDGPEAMAMFESMDHPAVPDVVVLDNRMPGRSGIDVAAEMLAAEPAQRIVLYSGYLDDALVERADELGVAACVAKHEIDRLAEVVSELIDREPN